MFWGEAGRYEKCFSKEMYRQSKKRKSLEEANLPYSDTMPSEGDFYTVYEELISESVFFCL